MNFIFDLDQTLLDFHATEYKALGIVLESNGLSFSDEIYQAFKTYNKSLWLELEKGTISRTELFTKRIQYVLDLCDGDTSSLDPLTINDNFIKTMSVNGILMEGAGDFIKKLKEKLGIQEMLEEITLLKIYLSDLKTLEKLHLRMMEKSQVVWMMHMQW